MLEYIPLLVALVNAVSVIVGGILVYRSQHALRADVVTAVTAVAENVQIVEKATNSMKDALVAATRKDALAEGEGIGKAKAEKIAGEVDRKVAEKTD